MMAIFQKSLAEERARKALIEKQFSTVPKLGRGFEKGETIDLSKVKVGIFLSQYIATRGHLVTTCYFIGVGQVKRKGD